MFHFLLGLAEVNNDSFIENLVSSFSYKATLE